MKKMWKKNNIHLPVLSDLCLDGKLHANLRFCPVTLYLFTAIHLEWHWWKLQKCPWKSPWKVLEFFFWKPALTMIYFMLVKDIISARLAPWYDKLMNLQERVILDGTVYGSYWPSSSCLWRLSLVPDELIKVYQLELSVDLCNMA